MEKIDFSINGGYTDPMRFGDIVFVYQMHEEKEIRWHSRLHTHEQDEYELHYFIQGTGRFRHRGGIHDILPGTLFLCGPGEMHSIIVSEESAPLTYYAVVFRPDPGETEVRVLAEKLLDAKPLYRLKGNYRLYFEDLREKTGSGRESLNRSAAHQFIAFLYLLTEAGREMHYSDSRNAHIEKALTILQASIFSRLSLDDLSRRVGLDKSYIIRLYKAKMGTTPMRYLKRLKLEAARGMLMTTGEPLCSIAGKLRFYSEFHFSKSFKAYTGVSPSGFRKGPPGETLRAGELLTPAETETTLTAGERA